MYQKLNKLIEYLYGYRNSLESACKDLNISYDDLSIEDLEEIDSQIFQCTSCGVWCDLSEEGEAPEGDRFCQDCSEIDSD
jgi:hypothetical protein